MKLKHFSLIFSILGILLLYFLSKLSAPPLISIDKMPDFENKQVILEGIVTEYQHTSQGGQLITIKDNNSSAVLFVEGEIDVEFGDRIQATGEVQKYKNSWELIVTDSQFLTILDKWKDQATPLWQLAIKPLKYLNLNVNVTGYIESISNAYFYLVDLDRKHSLLVFYRSVDNITIFPGQKVNVLGEFTFDEENFRYQLEIYDEKHSIFGLQES